MKKIILAAFVVFIAICGVGNSFAADVNLPPTVAKAIQSRVIILIYDSDDHNKMVAPMPINNGTGFVAEGGYIVTALHLIGSLGATIFSALPEKIVVKVKKYMEGEAMEAEIVLSDPHNDLMLLRLKGTASLELPPVTFANQFPNDGETVYATGFGRSGYFKATFPGVLIGKTTLNYTGFPVEYAPVIDRLLMKGFSGGPVFNVNGLLVGMVLGGSTDGNISGMLMMHPIRYLLKEAENRATKKVAQK